MSKLLTRTVSLAGAAALVFACGGGPTGSEEQSGGNGGGGAGGAGGGAGGPSGSLGSGGGGGGSGPGGPSCATATAQAEALPVSLVFMFDRSDSMSYDSKWTSSKQGLKAFFADPKSQGTSASLAFFCGDSCSAASYQTPSVALSALPDAQKFAQSIDGQTLCTGTPTGPALQGALAYAQTVKAQQPKGNVVVALVTDGEPRRCGNMQAAVLAAQSARGAGFKVYVIGVGANLTNLNLLASAGGTGQAILVATSNPQQLAADFEKAIDGIRASEMSCDFGIPAAQSGATLDVNKVNVTLQQGTTTSTIPYDAQCAGAGWRYDDVNAPTKISLCPSACDAAKKDASSKIQLVFGCKTEGGTPK